MLAFGKDPSQHHLRGKAKRWTLSLQMANSTLRPIQKSPKGIKQIPVTKYVPAPTGYKAQQDTNESDNVMSSRHFQVLWDKHNTTQHPTDFSVGSVTTTLGH